MVAQGDLSFLHPIEQGIGDLPIIELTDEQVIDATFGRFVDLDSEKERLAGFHSGKLIAVFEKRDQVYKPSKVLL